MPRLPLAPLPPPLLATSRDKVRISYETVVIIWSLVPLLLKKMVFRNMASMKSSEKIKFFILIVLNNLTK